MRGAVLAGRIMLSAMSCETTQRNPQEVTVLALDATGLQNTHELRVCHVRPGRVPRPEPLRTKMR
jgi:hypothetical protein